MNRLFASRHIVGQPVVMPSQPSIPRPQAARWRWLFLTHIQWHAVVSVLANLCDRSDDELVFRAWDIIDRVCQRWLSDKATKKGMLWRPICQLLDRARLNRAAKENGAKYQQLESPKSRCLPHSTLMAGSRLDQSDAYPVESLAPSHPDPPSLVPRTACGLRSLP